MEALEESSTELVVRCGDIVEKAKTDLQPHSTPECFMALQKYWRRAWVEAPMRDAEDRGGHPPLAATQHEVPPDNVTSWRNEPRAVLLLTQGRYCVFVVNNIPAAVICIRIVVRMAGGLLASEDVTLFFIAENARAVVPVEGSGCWRLKPELATSKIASRKTQTKRTDKNANHMIHLMVDLEGGRKETYRWKQNMLVLGRGSSRSRTDEIVSHIGVRWEDLEVVQQM